MTEFDDRLVDTVNRRGKVMKFRIASWVLIPLFAILFQVYVPRFIEALSYLELPLLVTIYFSLMRRHPISGSLIGAGIGLVQDSLSQNYLGLFGIVKTVVGYTAASVSQRFDVENTALRFVLTFVFFVFHQFAVWFLARSLVGQNIEFQLPQTIIFAFLNAVVAVPFYMILDRLRVEGQ